MSVKKKGKKTLLLHFFAQVQCHELTKALSKSVHCMAAQVLEEKPLIG